MDGFLIGILLFAVVLVVCLAYAFTFVTAGVFIIMPEGIFTTIVNLYDGSPLASVVAIVRILIAIAFVYYLLKFLADKDDDSVLGTTVILSSIASVLSSLIIYLAVFKGGLDLALGMMQVELHVGLAIALVQTWRKWVFPSLVKVKVVELVNKLADWVSEDQFYQLEVTIAVLIAVMISSFSMGVVEFQKALDQFQGSSQIVIEEQPTETDLFQMERGDQWCTIPLYGMNKQDFVDFVPVDMIFTSCDVEQKEEVVAYASELGIIYIRLPYWYKMEVGDVFCRNNSQYFAEDCSTGDYLWLQVGYINK